MNLSLENRVLLSLIAKSSFDKSISFLQEGEKLEDINWAQVYEESALGTVMLFASSSLSPYKKYIPEDILRKWVAFSRKALTLNSYVASYQNELVDFLNKNGYKYVILKGLSSSSYYENPDLRMLGDVDFLIDSIKADEIALKLQNKLGYKKTTDIEHKCHINMVRTYEKIEMHYDIPGIPNGNKGLYVRQFIKNILDDTQRISLNGCEFSAPSHLLHGVVILLHTLHHMTGDGLGLRHLCDWGAYINKTAEMGFWGNDFIPFLKKIGLYTFASVISSVCKRYLGVNMPNGLTLADENICYEIITDIFNSGNFGAKDEAMHDSRLLISTDENKSKLTVLFDRLNSAVKSHWPWLNKWKILLPLAYIAFVIRYYIKVIKGERPTLSSLAPEADRRSSIYKKLEIYEDTK